jgi:DNA-binding SARP family transcriptional activator
MEERAEIGVLGPIELLGPAQLAVRSPRKRAVLAGLALGHGREVSTDRMIDLVWGGAPPRTAHHALQVYVSELRALLGVNGVGLVTTSSGYRLDHAVVTTDLAMVDELIGAGRAAVVAERFQEAADVFHDALARWRGAPFVDVADTDEVLAERARLEAMHAGLRDELAEVYLALGRHAELIPQLEARIVTDPLRERSYEQLMVALYRSGRQTDALRVYQRARDCLLDQVGVEPGRRLRELEQAILLHDDDMLAPTLQVPVATGGSSGPTSVFVGRDTEVEQLVATARAAESDARTMLVFVGGEPGIGKTRLVDEAVARLTESGWMVLRGRCPDEGGAPPLWPFADALRVLDSIDASRAGDDALAPLVRLLRQDVSAPRPSSLPDGLTPFAVQDAVVDHVVGLVDQPTVLVIDDAHWTDELTLGVLARLAQRAPLVPLVVLVTYRVAEVDRSEHFDRAFARLVREPAVIRVSLGPLDGLAESAYLEALGLELTTEAVAWIRARSDGNPLFLGELARLAGAGAPIETMPNGLDQVLEARLAHLGTDVEVLSRAALIGREFEVGVLVRLGEDDGETISRALAAGARAGLLGQIAAGVWRFSHVLIAEAAAARLDGDVRRRLHLRIAEVIGITPAGDRHRRIVDEARHRIAALPIGDATLAAEACIVAGDASLQAFAYDDAVRLFESARSSLAFGPPEHHLRARALIGQAEALTATGDGDAARPLVDEALELLDPMMTPLPYAHAVRVLVLHRSAAASVGDHRLAELLRTAIDAVGDRDDWLGVQLRTDLAMLHYRTDVDGTAEALAREALARADASGNPLSTSFALTGLHQAIWSPSTLDERTDLATSAIATARLTGLAWHESMATSFRAVDAWERGDLGATERDIAAATELAARGRRPRFVWIARSWSALLDLYRGDVEAAEAGFAEALAVWGPVPNPDAVQCFFAQQLTLRLLDGRTGEIIDMLREVAATDPDQTMWNALLSYPLALAGAMDEAGRALDVVMAAGVSSLRRDVTQHVVLAMLSEAAALLQRADVARAVADQFEPFEDRRIVANIYGGGGFCWGSVAYQLGLCAQTVGDRDSARSWYERARDHAERDGAAQFAQRATASLAAVDR